MGCAARGGRRPARGRTTSALVAVLAAITVLALTPPTWSAFSASVSSGSALTVRSSFPDHPTQVKDKSPQFYHRFDEVNATATTVANDATADARHGNYAAAPTGPSIWWKFDEGSGTETADRAGSAKKGTLRGNAVPTAGRTGGGVRLDGSGDWVDTARPGANTNTAFTVAAWARLDSGSGTQTVVSQAAPDAAGGQISAYFLKWQPEPADPTTGHWEFMLPYSDSTGAAREQAESTAGQARPTGTWVHLAGVYRGDNQAIELYVNGTLVDSEPTTRTTATFATATGGLQVGRAKFGVGTWTDYFDGTVDDVRVWRRALSSTEIANVRNGVNDPPVAAWSMDDGGDFTTGTHDDTGGGNTLTFAANASSRNNVAFPSGSTNTANEYKVGPGAAKLNTASATGKNFGTAARAPLRTDQSFTVMAWAALYPSTVVSGAIGYWNAVLSQDTLPGTTGTNAWVLEYEKSSNQWTFSMTPPGSSTATQVYAQSGIAPPVPTTSTAPTWYHLVGVYDDVAKVGRIYVNGVLEGTSPTFDYTYNATGAVVVGRTKYNNQEVSHFHGLIDDVRIYQRALSGTSISNIYTSTNAGDAASWPLAGASEPGALNGAEKAHNPNSAVAFAGTGGGLTNKAGTAFSWDNASTWTTPPTDVTISCWFRTTSQHGGILAQLTNNNNRYAWEYDRALYLNNSNQLVFYTFNHQTYQGQMVTSPLGTYNDGRWHHVAAVISSSPGASYEAQTASAAPHGMSLYVDGVEVARDASYTVASTDNTNAIWRWGWGNLGYQFDRPASYGFTGTLDEMAVYHTALSKQEILWMYHANH